MKRIKIMLLSLLVLAVAGGTLAFKARFVFDACTAQALINGACPSVCPNFTTLVTTSADASQGAILSCTGLPIFSTNGQLTCRQTNGKPVPCIAVTFLMSNL